MGIVVAAGFLAAHGCLPPATPPQQRAARGADGAPAQPAACLTRHLKEAIRLNQERRPKYATLTGGASKRISDRLLRHERMLLPVARWLDGRARPWQRLGIPLLCEEIVSMDATPAFQTERRPPRAAAVPAVRPSDGAASVRRALSRGGFDDAARELRSALARLSATPHHDCMTRHILESALRVAELAPRHDAAARRVGARPTASLSRLLLRIHLLGLAEARRLDDLARPIQADGIGIICNDVPPIPPPVP